MANHDAPLNLATATERICRVCGHTQLAEDTPHEYAAGLTDRLICGNCGAHHLI